jgi:hypothetical protein
MFPPRTSCFVVVIDVHARAFKHLRHQVTLVSERGTACVVESPWPSGVVVKDPSGSKVATTTKGAMVSFPTSVGVTYTLSAAA